MKNLVFELGALEDLSWWVEQDRKKALKILKLLKEICKTPFEGSGQPEELKHDLFGFWSRRIDLRHRLVYQVIEEEGKESTIRIFSCRNHYQD